MESRLLKLVRLAETRAKSEPDGVIVLDEVEAIPAKFPYSHEKLALDSIVGGNPFLDAFLLTKKSRHSRKSGNPSYLSKESGPWPKWIAAACITATVHVLLIGAAAFGSKGPLRHAPLTEGLQANTLNKNGDEFVSVLIFVPDKSIHIKEEGNDSNIATAEPEELAEEKAELLATMSTGSASTLPSLEEAPEGDDVSEEAFGEGSEAALLFGRYMGQIKARIERAWEYPPNDSKTHRATHCRVQIKQSDKGEVQDIAVQRCDLSLDAQLSLVKAIQAASPLSAPPDEKLFTEVITLSFTAPAQQRSHRTM